MDWLYKKKYAQNKTSKLLKFSLVNDHPLRSKFSNSDSDDEILPEKSNVKKMNTLKAENLVVTSWDGLDPLSAAIFTSDSKDLNDHQSLFSNGIKRKVSSDHDNNSWKSFKTKILGKFNTTEKLSIKSSFVFEKGVFKPPNISQKIKNRLEQLDNFEENPINETLNLSQQEYIKRIQEMNTALVQAWENDQRVKALKIAIQCAKQLSSTSVIHFYPSKFVLITDILENFGDLVFDRIKNKTCLLKETATETCRNWFYKISSIRELLPRFYVECSILNIYCFLINQDQQLQQEYEKIFCRLMKMIRGIGDPLVAVYCRVYLCRIITKLQSSSKNIIELGLYDTMSDSKQLLRMTVRENLSSQNVDYQLYYSLFTPALDWILNVLFEKSGYSLYHNVLEHFKLSCRNNHCSALIFSSMIICYPSNFVAQHLNDFIKIIKKFDKDICNDIPQNFHYPQYLLIKNLSGPLIKEDNFFELYSLDKSAILKELLTQIQNLQSRRDYIICLESWSEIIAKYHSIETINQNLDHVIKNLINDHDKENYSNQLLQIISKIIHFGSDRFSCRDFFSMKNLLPYLDLLYKEDHKIAASKALLTFFIKSCSTKSIFSNESTKTTSDPVILNTLNYVCKLMHNFVNALTLEDEKRQITSLIIGFIERVSFGRDFESQLNFYIESRANFSNLDHVLSFIVHKVNALAMETHRSVNGRHTKKTMSFVNACVAFSYITIPSIEEIILRLQLYLSSSQVALINLCLPQTDALIKSAINLLRSLPSHSAAEGSDKKILSNDSFVFSYSSQILSTLIVVPDNPELGILYLFKGFYNVLKEYTFNSNYKILVWLNLFRYLVICTMESYPYSVEKVDSNDTLYAQDDAFLKEISTYCDIVFQESLDLFKKLSNEMGIEMLCNIALELINLVLIYGDTNKWSHVINQLWSWVSKKNEKHNLKALDLKMNQTCELIKKTFA